MKLKFDMIFEWDLDIRYPYVWTFVGRKWICFNEESLGRWTDPRIVVLLLSLLVLIVSEFGGELVVINAADSRIDVAETRSLDLRISPGMLEERYWVEMSMWKN